MHRFKVRKISKRTLIVIVVFAVLITLPLTITFGRYVYNKILDLYFRTQNFYFESDKLKLGGTDYSLDYWNGVDPYEIVVNLNSYKNNSLKSTSDIDYKVNYDCPSGVTCNVNKDKGIIYTETNNDSFVFTVTPTKTYKDGDSVSVSISATSTSPYKKTLSATFTFVVGTYGVSHEITDSSGDVYLEVKITNSLETYTVKEAFGDYSVGDSISIDTYNSLSSENQSKCRSVSATLSFDPDEVYVNNNSTTFLKAYDVKTQKINNYDYVNKFTFDLDASTSSTVKLYKKDVSKDYSTTGDGVVKVSYVF